MLKLACIPAFNEEKAIGEVIKKALMYVDEVAVCDDGSTDNTSDIAKRVGAYVIKHDKNFGKGQAIRSLFEYAKKRGADVIVTIDGDGQFKPEEIPKLLSPIIERNYDIVIGYRFDNDSEMPAYRKVGNKILDKITNLASELPFRDTQSGFRAYSKKAIEVIDFKTKGFSVDGEILIDASNKKLKIAETKVSVLYNLENKTSTKNPISHSIEVTSSLIELLAIKHPLTYLGIPGIILIGIGIIYAIIVLSIFNDTRYFSVPSTLVSFGSLFIGVMLLLMSVVLFSMRKILKRVS